MGSNNVLKCRKLGCEEGEGFGKECGFKGRRERDDENVML